MKARRAQQAQGGVAVQAEEPEDEAPEDEMAETPAATLQEDLAQLEHAYEAGIWP